MKYSYETIPPMIDTGFHVDEPKLWAITDIPVEEIPLSEIISNADIPYLEHEGAHDWNMTPHELIENFANESFHANKVQEADLSFPIEIFFFKGQWIILDGVHRFTKALMNNEKTIKIRRISPEIAEIVKRK